MKPRNWKQQGALAIDMPVTLLYMDDTMNPAEMDILTVTIARRYLTLSMEQMMTIPSELKF